MVSDLESNIVKLRWSLLLLFVFGYFFTKIHFDFSDQEYFNYNLFAFAACAVLLTQLKAFERRYAAVWLALVIMVTVYFIRFYWIVIDPLPVKVMLPEKPYYDMLDKRLELLYAFKLTIAIFVTFCLCSAAMLYFLGRQSKAHQKTSDTDVYVHMIIAKSLLIVLVPLMLGLYYVSHKYHIGEMGVASGEALPYRLKGVIFYTSIVFVPLFVLILINSAERSGHVLISRLGIFLLMFHGAIEMILRGSRSSLLLSILLLIFLVMAGGIRLRRNEKILIVIAIIAAFIMVPVMTSYRNQRAEHGLLLFDALNSAINFVGDNWWTNFSQGIKFILFRMPGIESVWCMLGQGVKPLGLHSIEVFRSINGMAGYLTYNIYPLKIQDNTLLAPSFVGWFYLVAGLPAVAFGGVAAAALSVFGWKSLSSHYLKCGPVAQVFLLWMFFLALTEGTLDTMGYMILAGVMCLFGVEVFIRFLNEMPYFKSHSARLHSD